MAKIVEAAKDAARDRIRTGKNSIAMKVAAVMTVGTALFGFGYSAVEYGMARSDSDNANYALDNGYGLSQKRVAQIQARELEAEHQADERSLALLIESLEATAIAFGGLELAYQGSSWRPERRGSIKLLGVNAVSYRLFDRLAGPVSSIEWNQRQATNKLQQGKNPYEDAILEAMPGIPPMSPPQQLENGRYY